MISYSYKEVLLHQSSQVDVCNPETGIIIISRFTYFVVYIYINFLSLLLSMILLHNNMISLEQVSLKAEAKQNDQVLDDVATLMEEMLTISGLLSWSSCLVPNRSKYSMYWKFLRSTSLDFWRNSDDTIVSILFLSSCVVFERAALKNPL